MTVKVILVDVNAKVVAAWRDVFEDHPEITITQGSMLDQQVSAWVTTTNARGSMDSGLDGAIRAHLGAAVQIRVQQAIAAQFHGQLAVGTATCVDTGCAAPRYLISTPSFTSGEHGREALDIALACAAAFQAVAAQNRALPGSITSVAVPGIGAATGRVPVEVCADLMWTAYNLLLHNDFADFVAMRGGLLSELGDLGNDLSVTAPRVSPLPLQPAPEPPAAPARRPGVLGPVVPSGPFVPRRGVAPMASAAPMTPRYAPAPQVAPARRPQTLGDFDDSE